MIRFNTFVLKNNKDFPEFRRGVLRRGNPTKSLRASWRGNLTKSLRGALRRGNLLFIHSFVLVGFGLAAQVIIPQDDFAPGWKKSGKPSTFIKADLFNHIDGGAELFLEYGFDKLLVQRYARGKSELTLDVYEMESPESALGIYLTKCGQETPVAGIRARNSGEKSQLTILKSKYFVYVNNFDGDARNLPAMAALANMALESIPEMPAEGWLEELPKEALVGRSQRLIRGPVALQPFFTFGEGDILELRGKIFGMLANYRGEGNALYTRLIIPYPDQKQALSVYENLKANLDPYLKILSTRANGFIFLDFKKKYGVVELSGSKLDIRFNLASVPKD
jgi:hypothetical protein